MATKTMNFASASESFTVDKGDVVDLENTGSDYTFATGTTFSKAVITFTGLTTTSTMWSSIKISVCMEHPGYGYTEVYSGTPLLPPKKSTEQVVLTVTDTSKLSNLCGNEIEDMWVEQRNEDGEIFLSSSATCSIVFTYTAPITYSNCTSPTSVKINGSSSDITVGTETVSLTCSGASGGSNNAISEYYVQYIDSADGTTWGSSWTNLSNMTKTQASAGYTTNSPATGSYRKFRVKTKGTVSGYDATSWKESPVVYKTDKSPCNPPSLVYTDSELSYDPVNLIWEGASDGTNNPITGYLVQRCESSDGVTFGNWIEPGTEASSSPLSVAPNETVGHYSKFRVRASSGLGDGYHSAWVESNILRKDMAPFKGFTDDPLIQKETKIKAIHMAEIQNRINDLLLFNGKESFSFADIVAGKTKLSGWTSHVIELRQATDLLKTSHENWLEITENKPRADVITQLRDIVIGYCKVTIMVDGENGLPENCIVTVRNTKNNSIIEEFEYVEPKMIRILPGTAYRIECSQSSDYTLSPFSNIMVAEEDAFVNVELMYRNAMRYGFKREKANSDPAARITYLYDAVGMTPTSRTSATTLDVGSWQNFIDELCRPVMLKTDGTVDYELNHGNQTLKLDGSTSDIASSSYDGNAMVEFKKYKWVHRSEDDAYEYVIFSDAQWDDTYHAYAHTDLNGNIADAFYYGMFKSVLVGGKARSIGGQGTTTTGYTLAKEMQYAQANGTGYEISSKSQRDYICDLLTLISCNDNSQASFGNGFCNTSSVQACSTTRTAGAFSGSTSSKTAEVKTLYVEGLWGNSAERITGLFYDYSRGGFLVKMTPPYNTTGDDYYATNINITGTSGSHISGSSCTDLGGWLPTTLDGSEGSYCSDGAWYSNTIVGCARVGGSYNNDPLNGSRYTILSQNASYSSANYTSFRLSYIPTV